MLKETVTTVENHNFRHVSGCSRKKDVLLFYAPTCRTTTQHLTLNKCTCRPIHEHNTSEIVLAFVTQQRGHMQKVLYQMTVVNHRKHIDWGERIYGMALAARHVGKANPSNVTESVFFGLVNTQREIGCLRFRARRQVPFTRRLQPSGYGATVKMRFPRFGFIRQIYPETAEPHIGQWLAEELKRTSVLSNVKPRQRVLITAGSRGIDSKLEVLRCLVKEVKAAGGIPVIFPAMGSHGGGTAKGQVEVLSSLRITEEAVGALIHEKLEYVEINHPASPIPLYADREAVEADHIILVNRVKEHTEYIGDTESGLLKMAVVGLGRQQGAEAMHHLAVNISYSKAIHGVATALFDRLNILAGVALLEDHRNALRSLEVIPAGQIFTREPVLLEESRAFKPKLPFDELDVLIIDEIGKEISGTGADTKVVGRIMNIYEKECRSPRILRIIIRDLTDDTGGNAIGVGLADYITKKVFQKIDFEKTALNCITGGTPEKGRVPIALPTDRIAMEAAFRTIGVWNPDTVRVAWIENTKNLEWLAASSALIEKSSCREDVQVHGKRFSLPFKADGSLPRLETLFSGASV